MKYIINIDKLPYENPSEDLRQYEIDIDVLRRKGNIYDSLIIDDTARVIRRIEHKNGEDYILENPIIENLSMIKIELFEGVNYIYITVNGQILSTSTIVIDYLLKNDFTETYPTVIEMHSAIEQSANQITLEVNKKADADKIISLINLSPEAITINSNRISLEGKEINLTSDNISINSKNFSVDKNGNMTCKSATLNNGSILITKSIYSEGDGGYVDEIILKADKDSVEIGGFNLYPTIDTISGAILPNLGYKSVNDTYPILKYNKTNPEESRFDLHIGNIYAINSIEYGTKLYSPNSSGIYLDQYGNIYTQKTITSGNWRVQNGNNIPFKVEFSDNSIRTRGVYPQATNTYDLGSGNYYWNNVFSKYFVVGTRFVIPKNGSDGYGLCNTDGKPIIRDWGNNNVVVTATGGTLCLGYQNTTGLDFMKGAATMDSDGTLHLNTITSKALGANLLYSTSSASYFGHGSDEASGKTTNLRGNTVRVYAHTSGAVYLGSSGSTAITSDENLKNIYEIDDKYIEFFNNLKPVTYTYKDKGHRKHFGFGARQVEESLIKAGLTTEQFAGILIDKDVTISADEMGTEEDVHFDELYSLRYEEFVSLNTHMIQKQAKEIAELKEIILKQQEEIEELKSLMKGE